MIVRIIDGNKIVRPNTRPGSLGDGTDFNWNDLSPAEQKAISRGGLKALGVSLVLAGLFGAGILYYGARADLSNSKENNNPKAVKVSDDNARNK